MLERYAANCFYLAYTYIWFLYHWWYYVVSNQKELYRQETGHFWSFVRFNDFRMCLVASLHSYLNFRWIGLLAHDKLRDCLRGSPYIFFILSCILPNLDDSILFLHYNSVLPDPWLLLLQKNAILELNWFRHMGITFVKWMVFWWNDLIIYPKSNLYDLSRWI